MKRWDTEKKIYEFLGVNIFRKYILFNCEKLFNKLNLYDSSYHIEQNSIYGIKLFKQRSKRNAMLHIFSLSVWIAAFFLCSSILWHGFIFILIDSYSIMTQRYLHIRCNIFILDETYY